MLNEFKAFIQRGNVVDLAVGVVIGAAFGKIVSSLTDDLIMPVLGLVTGGVDFSQMKAVLKPASTDAAGKEIAEVALRYGNFINVIIQFLLIAFVIFLLVKALNQIMKPAEPTPVGPAEDVVLLGEIRDLLKKN